MSATATEALAEPISVVGLGTTPELRAQRGPVAPIPLPPRKWPEPYRRCTPTEVQATIANRPPRPKPLQPARDALPDELHATVTEVRAVLEALGWEVHPTYAIGPQETGARRTLALRCFREEAYAFAVWEYGTTPKGAPSATVDSAWLVRPELRKLGITEWKLAMGIQPKPKKAPSKKKPPCPQCTTVHTKKAGCPPHSTLPFETPPPEGQ